MGQIPREKKDLPMREADLLPTNGASTACSSRPTGVPSPPPHAALLPCPLPWISPLPTALHLCIISQPQDDEMIVGDCCRTFPEPAGWDPEHRKGKSPCSWTVGEGREAVVDLDGDIHLCASPGPDKAAAAVGPDEAGKARTRHGEQRVGTGPGEGASELLEEARAASSRSTSQPQLRPLQPEQKQPRACVPGTLCRWISETGFPEKGQPGSWECTGWGLPPPPHPNQLNTNSSRSLARAF